MGTTPDPHKQPVAGPGEPIDLSESVAGEEDPGASIDIAGKREATVSRDKSAPAPAADKPRGGL